MSEPKSLNEMIALFDSYLPKSGPALIEQVKGFSVTLTALALDNRLTTAEKFTISAVGGIVDSTIRRMERERDMPAAADQPDNLTSLDM